MTSGAWWGDDIIPRCQLSSSYGLGLKTFLMIWRKRLRSILNQGMNDKGVFRTAKATPGPLNMFFFYDLLLKSVQKLKHICFMRSCCHVILTSARKNLRLARYLLCLPINVLCRCIEVSSLLSTKHIFLLLVDILTIYFAVEF